MIRRTIFSMLLIMAAFASNAQIQVMKLLTPDAKDYKIGFGAFLKFALPVNEVDYATLEGGLNLFRRKDYPEYGIATVPVKVGYKYTLDRSGAGLYVEPQVGYNVVGIGSKWGDYDIEEPNIAGPVTALHVGYMFEGENFRLDLGTYAEAGFSSEGTTAFVGIRLSYPLSFGRRSW